MKIENKEKSNKDLLQKIIASKQFKNTMLTILLIVFVGGYTVFFTSPFYMPDNKSNLRITELNTAEQLDNTHEFTIVRWQYCEEEKKMEVEIDVNNSSFDGIYSYTYNVMTDPNSIAKVKPIIEKDSLIILQIENISPKFKIVSLQLSLPDDKNTVLKLYTNIEAVERVENLDIQTEEQYNINRLYRNITTYQKYIEDIKTDITEANQKIIYIELQNKELTESRKYKTETEIEEIDSRIQSNKAYIEEEKHKIEKFNQSVLEYENKIKLIKQQLADMEKV